MERIRATLGILSTTESLEQLGELHTSGALDDLEYAKAKDRVIREAKT